jgi:hypothetical protein
MTTEFPGKGVTPGMVVGGDMTDPDPTMAGQMKVMDPTKHSAANFPQSGLPFSTRMQPASKSSQSEFGGVPDLGSMTMTQKAGGGAPVIMGTMLDMTSPQGGNQSSKVGGAYQTNKNSGMYKTTPVQKKQEGGVEVKRRQGM